MKEKQPTSRLKRFWVWVLGLLNAAALLPLYWIGRYNYPSWDDFSWTVNVRDAAQSSGFGAAWWDAVLATGHESFFEHYGNWAGLLNALQPDVWTKAVGENPYRLTSFFMLTLLLACTGALVSAVGKRLRASRTDLALAFFLLCLLLVQFCPSPVEAFYWYTGAVSYTVGFSLFLAGMALVLRLTEAPHAAMGTIWRCLLTAVLGFCTSAVTYLTPAFSFCLLLLLLCGLCAVFRRKSALPLYAYAAAYLTGFLMVLFSPGAQARLSGSGSAIGALSAIGRSFFFTALYAARWCSVPLLACFLALGVLLWPLVKRLRFSFPLPALVTLLSYCFLATVSTPVIFGVSGRGSGRVFNMVYWIFCLLALVNIGYWIGWLQHRADAAFLSQGFLFVKKRKLSASLLLFLVFALGCVQWDGFDLFNDSLAFTVDSRVSGISAVWSLATGEAQAYAAERQERLGVLLDDTQTDPIFDAIQSRPRLLFYTDLDQGNVAGYYGKHSITVLQEGQNQP